MKLLVTILLIFPIYSTFSEGSEDWYSEGTYYDSLKKLNDIKDRSYPAVQIVCPKELLISSHEETGKKKFYPPCKDNDSCETKKLLLVTAEYEGDLTRTIGKFIENNIIHNGKVFPYFGTRAIIGGKSPTHGLPTDEKMKKFTPGELSDKVGSFLSGSTSSIIFTDVDGVEKRRDPLQIEKYNPGGGLYLPTNAVCEDTIIPELESLVKQYRSASSPVYKHLAKTSYRQLLEEQYLPENCLDRVEDYSSYLPSTLTGGDFINYNASGSRDLVTGTHTVYQKLLPIGYNGLSIMSPTQPLQDGVIYTGENSLGIENFTLIQDVDDLYTIQRTGAGKRSGIVYGNGQYWGGKRDRYYRVFDPLVDVYFDDELVILGGDFDINDIEIFPGTGHSYGYLLGLSRQCESDYDGNGQVTMSEIFYRELSVEGIRATLISGDYLVDYNMYGGQMANRPYEWNKRLYNSTDSNNPSFQKRNLYKSFIARKYSDNYLTTLAAGHYNVIHNFDNENSCASSSYGEDFIKLDAVTLNDLR